MCCLSCDSYYDLQRLVLLLSFSKDISWDSEKSNGLSVVRSPKHIGVVFYPFVSCMCRLRFISTTLTFHPITGRKWWIKAEEHLVQQPLTKFFVHSGLLALIYLKHRHNFANGWPFSSPPTLLTKMKMKPESRRKTQRSAKSIHKVLTTLAIIQRLPFCLMHRADYPQRD